MGSYLNENSISHACFTLDTILIWIYTINIWIVIETSNELD